jgi:fructokinase
MSGSWVQTDPDRPTGRVFVKPRGVDVTYDIAAGAAWDVIQYDPDLEDLAREADAVAFGSLAQRDAQSRNSIYRFLDEARRAIRLYDVNLRSSGGQEFYNRNIFDRSCGFATLVKLNDDELPVVLGTLGHDDAQSLRQAYELEAIVLTRGSEGVAAYTDQGFIEGKPATANPDKDSDPVGAGDSCSAAILASRILNKSWQETLDFANRVGAYVVGQSGATPELPSDLVQQLKS